MSAPDKDAREAAEFAATYWGGTGCEPAYAGTTAGRRDIDGGRPTFRRAWTFTSLDDAWPYVMYRSETTDHFVVQSLCDDGFAEFWLEGDEWVVRTGWSNDMKRVPR
jgi:hypothetical protein